jgi:hypothetical protein
MFDPTHSRKIPGQTIAAATTAAKKRFASLRCLVKLPCAACCPDSGLIGLNLLVDALARSRTDLHASSPNSPIRFSAPHYPLLMIAEDGTDSSEVYGGVHWRGHCQPGNGGQIVGCDHDLADRQPNECRRPDPCVDIHAKLLLVR